MSNTIFASTIREVPSDKHYVILEQSSYYTPGDERSRTNPGHGYPASTTNFLTYKAYTDFKDWEEQIDYLTRANKSFKAYVAHPATVEVKTTVKVDV